MSSIGGGMAEWEGGGAAGKRRTRVDETCLRSSSGGCVLIRHCLTLSLSLRFSHFLSPSTSLFCLV
jgi:hypothetical protein